MDTLSDKVATAILEDVVAGAFPVGSLLPTEAEIAAAHSVSRLTVREAIHILRAQKVVKVHRGRGTEVCSPTEWISLQAMVRMHAGDRGPGVVDQLLEARRMLEIGAAQLAAKRRSDDDLAAMMGAQERMRAAGEVGDILSFAEEDLNFHAALVKASGNLFVPMLIDTFGPLLADTRRRMSARPAIRLHAIEHHQRVLDTIRAGDAEAARIAMVDHMDQTCADFTHQIAEARTDSLVSDLPPERTTPAADLGRLLSSTRCLVVLDDDPTGTQAVADIPVLTSWEIEDLRWAFEQSTAGFFVLTNTRSLDEDAAAARVRTIAQRCCTVSAELGVEVVFASRSDSTLRGHFPLETDTVCEVLAAHGLGIDGVIIAPAYIEAGRITINSNHWVNTPAGYIPVGESEFARDETFGFTQSHLAWWVEEKTSGRTRAGDVERLTLIDLRLGGPELVAERLKLAKNGAVIVTDAVTDNDLRVLAQALLLAEAAGRRFVYRTGPSFVRARLGQSATPPVDPNTLLADRADIGGGLIVVGSHVPTTSRQLATLRERVELQYVELDVPRVLSPDRDQYVKTIADEVVQRLGSGTVVLHTTRELRRGATDPESLVIARRVSAATSTVSRAVAEQCKLRYILAKGGITSSDIATELGMSRAWVKGSMLPGIVSAWTPINGIAAGVPFIVFAGNVGGPDALAEVVKGLER
jgi:uncharacterized protein YgbK (DUF1537 family)/DNA-binding FadR family transcriptional regulator